MNRGIDDSCSMEDFLKVTLVSEGGDGNSAYYTYRIESDIDAIVVNGEETNVLEFTIIGNCENSGFLESVRRLTSTPIEKEKTMSQFVKLTGMRGQPVYVVADAVSSVHEEHMGEHHYTSVGTMSGPLNVKDSVQEVMKVLDYASGDTPAEPPHVIRHEIDTGKIYIDGSAFKEWLEKRFGGDT
jgi:hypothetical protein